MPQNKFRFIAKKVLTAMNIDLEPIEIELIFKKISKKSNYIIHSQFNELLLELVKKIFPQDYLKDKKKIVNYVLNYLFECYNTLLQDSNNLAQCRNYKYNSIMSLISVSPNDIQILILNDIFFTINKIYEVYFVNEFSDNPKTIMKSSKNLIEFSRDFQILPYIMNETQIMTYYKLTTHYEQPYKFVNKEKNKGLLFTLNHFMLFFIHISLYYFSKCFEDNEKTNLNDEIKDESKLLLFLEKMENSEGMKNFSKKLVKSSSINLSLIPSEKLYYKVGDIKKNNKY